MDVDFDAARQRINERLNQELTRIRNLPKKSKIKICNKHGLKHAHHMNTGLLKSLEVDLAVIKREERRVTNELNKKRKCFTENTQRSFPRLLPIPGQENNEHVEKKREFPNHHSPHRFHASWSQPELPDYFSRLQSLENQHRKAFLMAITEESKRTTKQIIEENIKKMEKRSSTNPEGESDSLVTRLKGESDSLVTRLNRHQELRQSCFPSLLGSNNTRASVLGTIMEKKRPHPKADAYYKGTTYFMPEATTVSKAEKQLNVSKGKVNDNQMTKRLNGLKFLPEIKVSEYEKTPKTKLKNIIERRVVVNNRKDVSQLLSHDGLKLNQTVIKMKKKLNSETKLEGTMKMRKENSVFTKHWS